MTGHPVSEMIAPFVGKQIPGGCEHCDAYQTVKRAGDHFADVAGINYDLKDCWVVNVHHDDWCPWWIRHQNRAARRAAVKRAKRRRAS
jgi:hypothetical protein